MANTGVVPGSERATVRASSGPSVAGNGWGGGIESMSWASSASDKPSAVTVPTSPGAGRQTTSALSRPQGLHRQPAPVASGSGVKSPIRGASASSHGNSASVVVTSTDREPSP